MPRPRCACGTTMGVLTGTEYMAHLVRCRSVRPEIRAWAATSAVAAAIPSKTHPTPAAVLQLSLIPPNPAEGQAWLMRLRFGRHTGRDPRKGRP